MSKKFNIREWVLSVKYWSILFIPHIAICLIFLIYTLVGASIIQEIEADDSSSINLSQTPPVSTRHIERERDRLLSKIIDKRQAIDLQQYTKYIHKQILEYEEEIKKRYQFTSKSILSTTRELPRWTFAGSLYFIGTILTTIGSAEHTPVTNIGKCFIMIYAALGIPLTLVLLADLSLLLKRYIKYMSSLFSRLYSTRYFLHIRQWTILRFIEDHLGIARPNLPDDDPFSLAIKFLGSSSSFESDLHGNEPDTGRGGGGGGGRFQRRRRSSLHVKRLKTFFHILSDAVNDVHDDVDLTILQLIVTLCFYLLFGAFLVPSSSTSFFDRIYLCFTSIFTIGSRNEHRTGIYEYNLKWVLASAIYLLFGLAIVSLCITAVQARIQISINNLGKKTLRDLVEFLRQMGFHELSTDDILATTDVNNHRFSASSSDSLLSRQQRLTRAVSPPLDQSVPMSIVRPIGIAEPLRRLSTGLIIRTLKGPLSGEAGDTNTDKSVQVNTIIRACGRCAGSSPSPASSMLSVKRHVRISPSTSSAADSSSGCEDDDLPAEPPPNLDRLRQRRATLVAKTIINQMATQPPMNLSSIDEPLPSSTFLLPHYRHRSADPPKYSIKTISPPTSPKPTTTTTTLRKRENSQEEFLAISQQISSLLTPSDDEN